MRTLVFGLMLAACSGDVGKLVDSGAVCTKALYDSCRDEHDCTSANCKPFEAAGIIVASHEAWDGSGYPRGLAGEAIHIGARIISVVDTFDALTWGLSHRDPVSCARAAAELVRSAGTQFDPAVVHAWLRVCDGLQDRDEPVDASPLMDSVS